LLLPEQGILFLFSTGSRYSTYLPPPLTGGFIIDQGLKSQA